MYGLFHFDESSALRLRSGVDHVLYICKDRCPVNQHRSCTGLNFVLNHKMRAMKRHKIRTCVCDMCIIRIVIIIIKVHIIYINPHPLKCVP